MPFSFTQIEKTKSQTITIVFFFLVLLYFAAIWFISFLSHNYPAFDALMSGESASWKNLPLPKNLLVLAVALILGAGHWFFIVQELQERILRILKAKSPDLTNPEQKMFSNIIEELRVATGGTPIEGMIIPSLSLNACAVTDGESVPVIAITSGLLYKLNRAQLEAVIGHEAGHILNGDGEGALIISAMFETFGAALRGIRFVIEGMFDSSSSQDGSSWNQPTCYRTRWGSRSDSKIDKGPIHLVLFIVLVIAVMWVVYMFSLLMRMFISREREYRADAVSARLTRNPLALAEALHIITNRRHTLLDSGDALETLFIVNPRFSSLDAQEGLFPDLFSTHPPLQNRIKILLDMAHEKEEHLVQTLQSIQNEEKEEWKRQVKERQTPAPKSGLTDIFPFPQNGGVAPVDVTRICPACQGGLESVTYENTSILKCRVCEGILVGEDAIAGILHRKQYTFDPRIKNMAVTLMDERFLGKYEPFVFTVSNRRYRCEQCKNRNQPMRKCLFNRFYHVEIDKCPACGLTWFDKDELEIMQCIFEMRDAESRR